MDWIHMVDFLHFFTREVIFGHFLFAFLHTNPSEKGPALKGMNLFKAQGELILSF